MDMFTTDFKETPYWWDHAPPEPKADTTLPKQVDVAIVGSGYTGLHAAIQTAKAGRSTLVIEAEAAGYGASTRNGGQVSTSIKASLPQLTKKYGPQLAAEILGEGQASLTFIKQFIDDEKVDCDFQVVGRFHGAHTPKQYQQLANGLGVNRDVFSDDAFIVPRSDQPTELGTEAYHGGVVFPHHASLHPAKYHRGLLGIARNNGAQIVTHCRVLDLDRDISGFRLKTQMGEVRAKRVILATNGYTGPLSPWQQRRIIPIGSYIIATEELPKSVMDRLMPTDRILSDTRKLVYYYRPSPDRKRILFGGRVSLQETDPSRTGPKLHAELARLFPELAQTKISHSWSGFVGYTFDTLMHAGNDDGLYYAMGYCGSGVGMASYLGMRIGQQAADNPAGLTAFNKIPFPTRPLYFGNPWFLAPSVLAYRIRDRLGV
ncbi:NAD(P)/FAD-dependent oxidoreductase [Phaeobacter marinintestinus]|uniref:NAD(P)/FAD-dependent oxidoreductase n=1 Tax=Falsiphaeobacter marinintestinus TaxID=1492905 RepID=UPI0011B561A7|nr:FAD-binding oxidoreductase [Phaeobacter marinintestinus]